MTGGVRDWSGEVPDVLKYRVIRGVDKYRCVWPILRDGTCQRNEARDKRCLRPFCVLLKMKDEDIISPPRLKIFNPLRGLSTSRRHHPSLLRDSRIRTYVSTMTPGTVSVKTVHCRPWDKTYSVLKFSRTMEYSYSRRMEGRRWVSSLRSKSLGKESSNIKVHKGVLVGDSGNEISQDKPGRCQKFKQRRFRVPL